MSSLATAFRCAREWPESSVPLGMYCRNRLLVYLWTPSFLSRRSELSDGVIRHFSAASRPSRVVPTPQSGACCGRLVTKNTLGRDRVPWYVSSRAITIALRNADGWPTMTRVLHWASSRVRRIGVWGWLSLLIIVLATSAKALESTFYWFASPDDDALFVRMANGFVHGQWSSSWRSTGALSLAKAVGYPIFLSASHVLPWTPTLSAFLLYLLGVVLISTSWYLIRGSKPQAFLVVLILALNPIFFTVANQRIERDAFICALSTVAIGLSLLIGVRIRDDRTVARVLLSTAMVIVLGITVGVVAITKPIWPWLLIGLAALGLPFVTQLARLRGWKSASIRVGLVILALLAGLFATVQTTKTMNSRRYHVALVDDYSSGAFARTWQLWASVEAGKVRQFVPITSTMRAAVYTISPTAAKLAPYLESPNDPWKAIDCQWGGLHICDESGTWFPWDLRSAAEATGEIHSVQDFQRFFSHVVDDIARACSDGKLRCSTSLVLATGLPPLDEISLTDVLSDTAHGLQDMVWNRLPIGPPPFDVAPSTSSYAVGDTPTPAQYDLWSSVVSGMPSPRSLTKSTGSTIVYPPLRVVDVLYGIGNLALIALAAAGAGACVFASSRGRRRRRRGESISGAAIAGALLVAPLLGMGSLALFQAALRTGWVSPLYWTDFATPFELALVIGGVTGWTYLVSRYREGRLNA